VGSLTFYFDRNFGKRLPESIQRAAPPFTVEWHHSSKNNFSQDMPDDEWLTIAGTNGWIVFSHDRKFHDLTVEIAAIKQHQVGCFYLWGAQLPTWDKLQCFVRGYNRIATLAAATPKPFIFHLGFSNRITKVAIP
jgi:hypothetical protein